MLMTYVNSKDEDQPAHLNSVIFIGCIDSMMSMDAIFKILTL